MSPSVASVLHHDDHVVEPPRSARSHSPGSRNPGRFGPGSLAARCCWRLRRGEPAVEKPRSRWLAASRPMVSDGCGAGKPRPPPMVHGLAHRPGGIGRRVIDPEVAAAALGPPQGRVGHEPCHERGRAATAGVRRRDASSAASLSSSGPSRRTPRNRSVAVADPRRAPSPRRLGIQPIDRCRQARSTPSSAIAARRPKTSASASEFDASRFAPWTPVLATSPAANTPETLVRPHRSVSTPAHAVMGCRRDRYGLGGDVQPDLAALLVGRREPRGDVGHRGRVELRPARRSPRASAARRARRRREARGHPAGGSGP